MLTILRTEKARNKRSAVRFTFSVELERHRPSLFIRTTEK